jgi:hypothetical protein
MIAALRPRAGGTAWVPAKAVVAIHPVARSHWASAPMLPEWQAFFACALITYDFHIEDHTLAPLSRPQGV